jgi:dihydrofolate reductase
MRELTADLFISLDGFASGLKQPPFFGYFGQDLGNWVRELLDEPQVIILGRVTYEALARNSASAPDPVSLRMSDLPKLVFSTTLREPLSWKNTQLHGRNVADVIRALKQQRGDPLRSMGSVSLAKSMMQLGLVDRLRLMIFPLILGNVGREPIYAGDELAHLELMDTKVLDSRLMLMEYRPIGRQTVVKSPL